MQHGDQSNQTAPARDDQAERRERLSAESKRLLDAVDEVHALEAEKREHDISTPGFHRLAEQILAKSREIFRGAYRERDIGEELETTDVAMNEVGGRHQD
jgi:hypothetical protein